MPDVFALAVHNDSAPALEALLQENKEAAAAVADHQKRPHHYAANHAAAMADEFRSLPHHYAAISGASKCLQLLLAVFPDGAKAANEFGSTPHHYAANNKVEKCLQLLLSVHPGGASTVNEDGWLPHHYAANSNASKCLKVLLDFYPEGSKAVNEDGMLPIHHAAESNSDQCVQLLLKAHPDGAKTPNEDGMLPLHFAAENHAEACLKILLEAFPMAARVANEDGMLPLHFAAHAKDLKCLEMVLRAYPDAIKEADKEGKLPVHYALDDESGTCLQLLLGAYPNGVTNEDIARVLDRPVEVWGRAAFETILAIMIASAHEDLLGMVSFAAPLSAVLASQARSLGAEDSAEREALSQRGEQVQHAMSALIGMAARKGDIDARMSGGNGRQALDVLVDSECAIVLSHSVLRKFIRGRWYSHYRSLEEIRQALVGFGAIQEGLKFCILITFNVSLLAALAVFPPLERMLRSELTAAGLQCLYLYQPAFKFWASAFSNLMLALLLTCAPVTDVRGVGHAPFFSMIMAFVYSAASSASVICALRVQRVPLVLALVLFLFLLCSVAFILMVLEVATSWDASSHSLLLLWAVGCTFFNLHALAMQPRRWMAERMKWVELTSTVLLIAGLGKTNAAGLDEGGASTLIAAGTGLLLLSQASRVLLQSATFGPIVLTIEALAVTVLQWVALYLTCLFCFGVTIYGLIKRSGELSGGVCTIFDATRPSHWTFMDELLRLGGTILELSAATLGSENELSCPSKSDFWLVAPLTMTIYLTVIGCLLLNLLIAMVLRTFGDGFEFQSANYHFRSALTTLNYEASAAVPMPLTLFSLPYVAVASMAALVQKVLKCEDSGGILSYQKLGLNGEGITGEAGSKASEWKLAGTHEQIKADAMAYIEGCMVEKDQGVRWKVHTSRSIADLASRLMEIQRSTAHELARVKKQLEGMAKMLERAAVSA